MHMPGTNASLPYIYARSLQASRLRNARPLEARPVSRFFSSTPNRNSQQPRAVTEQKTISSTEEQILPDKSKDVSQASQRQSKMPAEQGAMSRRLAGVTEDAILEGGRAGRKAVEEAGFSDELKERLLERVKAHTFRSENSTAFAEASFTSRVGSGSRDIAAAQAWTGEENPEDTILRMLDDAKKPLKPGLRGPANIPSPVVDLRLKREPKQRPGQRLANARDKTSIYSISKDSQMSDDERQKMRQELKDRFSPEARAMPNSLRGLAALANERIEDAIARGQFKNIPRGKAIERDSRADNPFVNTTEYILNNMIQRQDIAPPWIEKQQELVKTAHVFRARLRNDWTRQASRTIASCGGTLEQQMRQADLYAAAERAYNPRTRAVEQVSVPTNATSDPVMLNITRVAPAESQIQGPLIQVTIEKNDSENMITEPTESAIEESSSQVESRSTKPLPAPFRIPEWEKSELSYLTLAITNLNSITRSYNLMAPDLAKKPYFSLERELKSCYADVAPTLSNAIKERAGHPAKEFVEKIGHRSGGVLERFGKDTAKIYDSKRPFYGFKEFWTDLFGEKRA